ncbi:MAG: hypothetical protein Ta2G_07430 [Termitinemataceae bacterium]|nr:MAG: hypothetical protein Ta2G_07430 [Termitinemataceae bacterium]
MVHIRKHLRAPLKTRGTQDCAGFFRSLKPKSADIMVLWRAFLAKRCGKRQCKIAAHEFLEVPLRNIFLLLIFLSVLQHALCETTIVEKEGKGIVVNTLPLKAKVYIDGAYRGLSPLKISDIASGAHSVKIKRDFFQNYSVKIIIPPEGCIEINVDLIPLKKDI